MAAQQLDEFERLEHGPGEDTTPQPQRAFISGPLSTGENREYFAQHYVTPIEAAMARGDRFVIGPIPHGVDADALDYLLAHHVDPSRITIFVTEAEDAIWGAKFRNRGVSVHVEGSAPRQRDATMTRESDYDILRWRTEDEAQAFYGDSWRPGHITNTEWNWRRRQGLQETKPWWESESAPEVKPEKEVEPRKENIARRAWEKLKPRD